MKVGMTRPEEQGTITETRVFGVKYTHLHLGNGDELYFTPYGWPLKDHLLPTNFLTDRTWFYQHSQKLRGTSSIYKVTTKPIADKSLEIVLKWNRMGQEIPGCMEMMDLWHVEFNSPFEEFALTYELRDSHRDIPGRVYTHKPLAIYIPKPHVALDRLGRKDYKMTSLMDGHEEVQLDMNRSYAVIYEWIKGMDAVQAFEQGLISEDLMGDLTVRSRDDLEEKGFTVADSKPHHVIVRKTSDNQLVTDKQGHPCYALIDFELLKRTPKREQLIRAAKRHNYLQKQAHRFEEQPSYAWPPNLKPVNILGVDYVYGQVEGTQSSLWVVGKDPTLFEYFVPDRWRETPRLKLSIQEQLYHTVTKDNIQLRWKISRVGEMPDVDPFTESEKRLIEHGYNSPFEEVALALELNRQGIPASYPRAIFMAPSKAQLHEALYDDRRYHTHANWLTPEGEPVLRKHQDYILFWGYWNGPDEMLALRDESPFKGIDVLLAYRTGLINETLYEMLLGQTKEVLASVGIEDLNLKGNHILLSIDNNNHLVMDDKGLPTIRIYNFEFLANSYSE